MVIKVFQFNAAYHCRLVEMTLKISYLDCEEEVVEIFKGEHKSPEYLAINSLGKLPSLKDGNYVIYER